VKFVSNFLKGSKKRVLIIGWDCAAPQLVFEAFKDDMPYTRQLMEEGIYGELESTIPPITVPAWMCMMTGKDPGELGIYGFRNRKDYSYSNLYIVSSKDVREPTLWDILGRHDKKSVVLGVPLTYPPRSIPGWMVTSFLTPSIDSQYTFPPDLKGEIASVVGEYLIDVRNFRTEERERIERELIEMTRKRFQLARHLMRTRDWDFFIVVEMGSDRLHHAFWRFWDKTHRKYEPDSPFSETMRNYYRLLDEELGRTLEDVEEDTTVLVVSDHGAKRMDGGICVNEWLQQHGYLKLKEQPKGITRFSTDMVDWGNTQVWSEGGYYARIFMNVQGREPHGIIPPADYERVRDELKARLEAIVDEEGRNIGTLVFKPEQVYAACRNVPPDLIVHFGDLYWRSVGSVGGGSIYTYENDTGPDDCNHAQMGLFILKSPHIQAKGKVPAKHLFDIAPTVLHEFGLDVPADMHGVPIEE